MEVTIVYGYKLSTTMALNPNETVIQLIERFMTECNMPGHSTTVTIRMNGRALPHNTSCGDIPSNSTLYYMNPAATFSASAQQALIRERANSPTTQHVIEQDLKQVYEHYPELLVNNINSVYIHIELNGHPDVAVIDTGAELSTISLDTAVRCGLEKHIDRRQDGKALGVGSSKIVGRIHLAQLKCGNEYFATNFVVIENVVGTLLGMPFLRMHRMIVDLASLQIRSKDVSLPIMSDSEVEEYKENLMAKVETNHMS